MRRALAAVVVLVSACSSSTAHELPTTTSLAAVDSTGAVMAQCTPSPATGRPSTERVDEAVFERFGPIGSAPRLTINAPNNAQGDIREMLAARIAGGVLVSEATPGYRAASSRSALEAVNLDGSTRWLTCVQGEINGLWAPAATTKSGGFAVVAIVTSLMGAPATIDWELVRLDDGRAIDSLKKLAVAAGLTATQLAESSVLASSATTLLFGRASLFADSGAPDHFLLFDMANQKAKNIPVPPEVVKAPSTIDYSFDVNGDPIVTERSYGSRVLTVLQGGKWTTDPSILRSTVGTRAWFEPTAPHAMVGLDAAGTTVWTNPAVTAPDVTSFDTAIGTVDGSVAVINGCAASMSAPCTPSLYGVDTTEGHVLWSVPGCRATPVVADGYVLASDANGCSPPCTPGWVLLNDRTGLVADPSQHWGPDDGFPRICRIDDGGLVLARSGGVVMVLNSATVSVWYPKASGSVGHTVSLP